ncbi:hypothetical protein [Parendozoicomonas sp. Alg238-R29]|uniref:hypothetical protein n=1 Tax=Parendozoicomonas sp. Alg238-R29 TaxID=2993446 RepID=UPI00248EA4F7|nr:hypothetical protein [Parendozoicomonas sp. Alg238-R29]
MALSWVKNTKTSTNMQFFSLPEKSDQLANRPIFCSPYCGKKVQPGVISRETGECVIPSENGSLRFPSGDFYITALTVNQGYSGKALFLAGTAGAAGSGVIVGTVADTSVAAGTSIAVYGFITFVKFIIDKLKR